MKQHNGILASLVSVALLVSGCNAQQAGNAGSRSSTDRTEAGTIDAAMMPERAVISDDEYVAHVLKLQERLANQGYTVRLENPFVVIGNEDAEMVQQRCEQTIRWAVQRLKNQYFPRDPDHIIEIWLFGDKESYETGCESLTGRKATTPFGFYSAAEKKLIMNIATGGGTLVHEIVHPFMAANFPACPSWFNEGLASLYEQSGSRDDRIIGYTNWRLRSLQLAIDDDRLPPFETMMKTTTREFYDDPSGTNYAQARYLCYYLQETGKLDDFYQGFHKNAADDPSGMQTLQTVLETTDLEAFQKSWQEWVMKLKF